MISEQMRKSIENGSEIRAMFETGKKLADRYGVENICDFSLGNPNLPAPGEVEDALIKVIREEDPVTLHGYMSNIGYEDVRSAIAESINDKYKTSLGAKNIVMTVGAAGGLNVIFKSILDPGENVVVFAPYFAEYGNYASNCGAVLRVAPTGAEDFLPDTEALQGMIDEKTRAVIINSPNNPTGVIYSESVIKGIAAVLMKKEKELGTDIYLISDEPYRELVYDRIEVPYVTHYYHNAIIGYSYSKSLSLPGERIGYLVIPDEVSDFENMIQAVATATRILGFVNAPSLQQKAIKYCLNARVDIDFYDRNRQMLYSGLRESGIECIYPEGAFYLWAKSPFPEAKKFVELANEYKLIIVPGTAFGCEGYVRLTYCVSPETIEKAIPRFRKMMEEIRGKQ